MKRIIIILTSYILVVFAFCLGLSFFWGHLPPLILGTAGSYKFLRGLSWFYLVLPSVFLSGIIAGCSVQWRKGTSNSVRRFSEAMMIRYRNLLLVSLVAVALCSLSEESFLPGVKKRISMLESAPYELNKAITTSKNLLEDGRTVLAWQYAKKAVSIAPKDKEALAQQKKTSDAMEEEHDRAMHSIDIKKTYEEEARPQETKDKNYSVRTLVENAEAALLEENYIMAHYWANLAVEVSTGIDTNRPKALKIASESWNKLNSVVEKIDSDSKKAYSKYERKRRGYKAFSEGDNLKAYYIFLSLNKDNEENKIKDPDVVKFLALAKEKIESEYFFFDETEGIEDLENNKNIYFLLSNPDSSKTVYYIDGAMDLKRAGGYVRYLEGFNMVTYDKDGKFLYSTYVDYAKLVPLSTKDFENEDLASLGINKDWGFVPKIILQSVDRYTENRIVKPKYSYEETGLPDSVKNTLNLRESFFAESLTEESNLNSEEIEKNVIILPMPFKDFSVISEASKGSGDISPISLFKIKSKAKSYGFAEEVFSQNLVTLFAYPIFILILCILAGIIGWNYRIEDEKVPFKTRWVIMLPFVGAVQFVILQILTYLFRMINYVIVGLAGGAAIVTAVVIYIIIFIIVTICFAARKV